jgi:hypothetical protein
MTVHKTDEEAAKAASFFANLPDAPATSAIEGPDDGEGGDEGEGGEGGETNFDDYPDPPETSAVKGPAEPEEEAEGTGGDEDDGKLEAVLKALKEGDEETLCDLLGEDPDKWKDGTRSRIAQRKAMSNLKRERDHFRESAAKVVDSWRPISEKIVDIDQTGDYKRVGQVVEMLFNRPWSEIREDVLRTERGLPPAPRKAAESQAAKLEPTVKNDLPEAHQARQLPGWEQGVAAVWAAAYDEDLGAPSISVRQAAARWVQQKKAEFKKLSELFGKGGSSSGSSGGASQSKSKKGADTGLQRAASQAGGKVRRKTPDEFFAEFS